MDKITKHPRAKWHEYKTGVFFITICCKEKTHFFGKISDNKMILSKEGQVVQNAFDVLESHHDSVFLDVFTIMPNHIHFICQITKKCDTKNDNLGVLKPPKYKKIEQLKFEERNHHNSRLSVIIGGLKSYVTREIRKFNKEFSWQYGYHDHIISHQCEYQMIYEYITNNVCRWNKDIFNSNKEM